MILFTLSPARLTPAQTGLKRPPPRKRARCGTNARTDGIETDYCLHYIFPDLPNARTDGIETNIGDVDIRVTNLTPAQTGLKRK